MTTNMFVVTIVTGGKTFTFEINPYSKGIEILPPETQLGSFFCNQIKVGEITEEQKTALLDIVRGLAENADTYRELSRGRSLWFQKYSGIATHRNAFIFTLRIKSVGFWKRDKHLHKACNYHKNHTIPFIL